LGKLGHRALVRDVIVVTATLEHHRENRKLVALTAQAGPTADQNV